MEWINTTVGEYCPFIYGKSLPQTKREKGDIPVYGSNGIVDFHNKFCVTPYGIIIGRKGSVGAVHLSEKPFWVIDTAFYAIKDDLDELRFSYYLLKTLNLDTMNSDSAVPGLNRENAHSLNICIPKNIEDRKLIGKKLALFDKKIQLNTQINQTLEAIAQAIFKSWFVDFDPVRAKAQAISDGKTSDEANLSAMAVISGKAIEDLSQTEYQELWEIADAFPSELVENAEFGEVPKGWEVRKIESIIKKIPAGKKYSQKTVQETGKVPVLDQGKSGLIGFHNDEAGVKASIENPVIVFANHTCYMRLISYDFSAIQNVFAFRGNELDIYWVYLATLGKQEFTEYKGHFPDFLIKEIIVPTTELTTLFGNFIKYQFMNIFENDKQNKILADLRDLLLPKLLSGEIEL